MTTDSPAGVWRWLVALVAVGAQNTKLIAAAAQDIYQNEYTAEKIKKSIDSIFFRGGLLLTVWIPFLALVWCLYVCAVYVQGLFGSHPLGFFEQLAVSREDLWKIIQKLATAAFLIKDHEIDFKKLAFYVTILIMLALAIRFLWSLLFNSLRHIFENTFHSTHFREFVYGEYKEWFNHESNQNIMLKFKGSFLLMAALRFAKPEDKPELKNIETWDKKDRVLESKWWMGTYCRWLLGKSTVNFPWWRAWANWCWLIRRSTVKYPMRIGYAIVKLSHEAKLEVEPSIYRRDLDSAYTLGYAYVAWYRRQMIYTSSVLGYAYVAWYPRYILWLLNKCKPAPIKYLHKKLESMKNTLASNDNKTFIDWVNEQVYCVDVTNSSKVPVIRPGLGVQAITIFNDHADNKTPNKPNWKVIIQKRAANVASSPGHFQFIPSGGFESHQTYRRKQFDTLLVNTLGRECSLQRGLLREFAEEVLGVPEFATNEKLDPDDVYRDPSIVALRRLMADTRKKQTEPTDHPILSACTRANYGSENTNPWAALVPLGTALSLVGFKPEISYALIIDSKEFFIERKLQRAENEAKGILTWPLTELDHLVNGEQTFVDASYVLLKLLIDEEQTLNCLLKQQLCPKGATYIISSLNKHFTDGVKDVSASPVTDTIQSAPLVGTQ